MDLGSVIWALLVSTFLLAFILIWLSIALNEHCYSILLYCIKKDVLLYYASFTLQWMHCTVLIFCNLNSPALFSFLLLDDFLALLHLAFLAVKTYICNKGLCETQAEHGVLCEWNELDKALIQEKLPGSFFCNQAPAHRVLSWSNVLWSGRNPHCSPEYRVRQSFWVPAQGNKLHLQTTPSCKKPSQPRLSKAFSISGQISFTPGTLPFSNFLSPYWPCQKIVFQNFLMAGSPSPWPSWIPPTLMFFNSWSPVWH